MFRRRQLNKKHRDDYESPPSVDEILLRCTEKPFMSSLDLTSSYWQIGLSQESKQYTAFMILNRGMEFNVTNLKGVKSLLDFVNFDTRFVNNYAKLRITRLKLIRKHVRFKWQKYNSLASHSV